MNTPVVVIGAGVNGLVAAQYLAKAGQRVLVLERRTAGDDSPDVGWIPPRIVRDLRLELHGLRVLRPDPWVSVSLPGGGRLDLWQDMARSVDAIRRLSPRDAATWPPFCERMRRVAALLETLYTAPPPDVFSRDLGDLLRLGKVAWQVRRLGKEGMSDLLRLLPMSVAELLDDSFESDALKGALGAAGVTHLHQGPRAGGTAFLLLHHHVGSPAGVFRPPLSNIGRVLGRLAGAEVRRGAEVANVTVRDARVTGVVLANGEEIPARLVVSTADPRRTLLGLVDPGWLDPDFVRAVGHIKCRGAAARVTLTLDRPADFAALAVAPSLDYLERAHDDAKYGRVSERPYVEARAYQTTADGRHRVDVHAQYAPDALREGAWDDTRRQALGDLVVQTLSEPVPALAAAIVDRAVFSPADLEAVYGFPEGHAYHGELTLDQILFMRPVPGCARYRTPIRGLYLAGPGTHPGGAVSGASGANAARAVRAEG